MLLAVRVGLHSLKVLIMTMNLSEKKANCSRFTCAGAGIIAVLAAFLSLTPLPAAGSDFAHAQKVIVPASSYDRRIDFSSIREQYTLPGGKKPSGKSGSSATAARTPTKTTTSTSKSNTAVKRQTEKTAQDKTPGKTTAQAPKAAAKTATTAGKEATPAAAGAGNTSKAISDLANSLTARMSPGLVAKMKQSAIDFQKSGKLEEAQRVLTRLAQMTPEDKANLQQLANIGVQRARNYLKTNDFQNALMQARTALSAIPNDPEATQILSQLYKKAGVDPNDVSSRLKTANTLYQQSRYAEAEVEYKASLAVKPTSEAYVGIGRVHEKLSGAGAGKQFYEHALEIDSNSAAAHREMGMHHLANNDVVSANSELSRALILDPQDKEAGASLVKLWQTQVSKMPNANSHLGLARAYQLNGDLQSAQAEYREVVRIDPNHPYLPAARQSFKIALARQEAEKSMTAARTLESQGLVNDAYQKASEAVGYSPGNSSYKIYEGELLEKLGQAGQAKQVYLNVLKDDPQNQAAVQKLKQLASVAAIDADTGAALVPRQTIVPDSGRGSVYRHPDGFPGSKFPTEMTADPLTLNRAANGAPIDHIGTLSGFMSQLRNQMLTSKTTNQKTEDAAASIIKQLTEPAEEAPAAGKSAGSDIKSLLKGSAAPEAGNTAAVEGGAASALANAAAALAAVKGGATAAAKTLSSKKTAESSPAAGTPKSAAPPKESQSSNNRLQELEKQNQQLKEQLAQMTGTGNPGWQGAASPETGIASAPAFNPGAAAYAPTCVPSPAATAPQSAPDYTALLNPPTAPPVLPQYQTAVPAQVSGSPASQYGLPAAPQGMPVPTGAQFPDPALKGQLAGSQPVRFELKQIKPTLRDVQLKVSLSNDSDAALKIPDSMQVVIKYANQSESELKASFDDDNLAAHGTVNGVVKVPFDKVDPTADLILRNLLPQELHIIRTAISQK
jgi:tetratricopeptide (TPR) repeat protein